MEYGVSEGEGGDDAMEGDVQVGDEEVSRPSRKRGTGTFKVLQYAAQLKRTRLATGDLTPVVVPSLELQTVRQLWDEYMIGINGEAALKTLEANYGPKWRQYKQGKAHWHQRNYSYDFIKVRAEPAHTRLRQCAQPT